MDIANINVIKNGTSEMRMLTEIDESEQVIITPEERWTDDQKAIVAEFEKQFPNGRPLPTPSEPVPTKEEILAQTVTQLTLENADLKQQVQTLSQTVANALI